MRPLEHLVPCRCLLSVGSCAGCSSSWLACRGAQAAAEPLSGTPADKGQPEGEPERLTAFNGLGLTALDVGPASSDVGMKGQVCSELSDSSSDWDPWNSPADSASTDPYEDLGEPPSTGARATAAVQRAAGGTPRKLVLNSNAPGRSAAKAQLQPQAAAERAGLSAMKALHSHGHGMTLALLPPQDGLNLHCRACSSRVSGQTGKRAADSAWLDDLLMAQACQAHTASHVCRRQARAGMRPRRRAVDRRM